MAHQNTGLEIVEEHDPKQWLRELNILEHSLQKKFKLIVPQIVFV